MNPETTDNDNLSYQSLLKSQKELCEQYAVDFRKVPDLNNKIITLGKVSQKIMEECISTSYQNVLRTFSYWEEVWKLSHDKKKLTPKQKSLLGLFLYLSLAEGMASENVQIIAFLLMQNGHDIYDPRKRRVVNSYKDLGNVDLFIKMQCLEKHGFTFITEAIDRNLRNCIAHLEYIVEENGTIINQKNGERINDITQKMDHLGCANTVVTLTLSYLIDDFKLKKKP